MIADILICVVIVCVFASLIPACISDFKTRTVMPNIWKYSAYIGIPLSFIALALKIISGELILTSMIASMVWAWILIAITIGLANIKDPFYKPTICEKCHYTFTNVQDIDKCPRCNYVNGKAILGGADMIAINIILITSFYLSNIFIPVFMMAFVVSSIAIMIIIKLKTKNLLNYRVPLIIPITSAYALTLIWIFVS